MVSKVLQCVSILIFKANFTKIIWGYTNLVIHTQKIRGNHDPSLFSHHAHAPHLFKTINSNHTLFIKSMGKAINSITFNNPQSTSKIIKLISRV